MVWGSRADQIASAQGKRPHHNLTAANCIEAVAEAVAAQVLALDRDDCLGSLAPEARAFWRIEPERRRPVSFP